jgi:hypothetical protein
MGEAALAFIRLQTSYHVDRDMMGVCAYDKARARAENVKQKHTIETI